MSLFQSLLIALWAGYCSYDDQGPQMLRRPLLVGPIVGLILGDLTTALIVSATLELMWMGLGNMAGYQTPDMIVGTIVGVTFAITTGQTSAEGIAAGVATATAVAILVQQFNLIFMFVRQFFAPWADKLAESGNFDSLLQINIASAILQFLIRFVPTFLIIYFGGTIVEQVMASLPAPFLAGLSKASGILPAVGLSILMTIIMKKGMWGFLIFGFVLNAYLKMDILGVTLISLAFATFYTWIMNVIDFQNTQSQNTNSNVKEGGYDL